jgi:hypothetical protein
VRQWLAHKLNRLVVWLHPACYDMRAHGVVEMDDPKAPTLRVKDESGIPARREDHQAVLWLTQAEAVRMRERWWRSYR